MGTGFRGRSYGYANTEFGQENTIYGVAFAGMEAREKCFGNNLGLGTVGMEECQRGGSVKFCLSIICQKRLVGQLINGHSECPTTAESTEPQIGSDRRV